MWENIDKTRPESWHYSIIRKSHYADGMQVLREMFPDAEADELNFVLFSTSGVHGTYNLIEEAQRAIEKKNNDEEFNEVTFLIVHPRLVSLRYGACEPRSMDDIEFLKKLRKSSKEVINLIGERMVELDEVGEDS